VSEEQLRQTLRLQQAFGESGDLTQFDAQDRLIKAQMYDAAGVPDLCVLARRHSGHIDRLRRLHLPMTGKVHQIMRDHLDRRPGLRGLCGPRKSMTGIWQAAAAVLAAERFDKP
jgi:DNA-binding GntR family transcriptional regulator